MPFYILKSIDHCCDCCGHVDEMKLLCSSITQEQLEQLIEECKEELTVFSHEDFLKFMHEKGVDGKYVPFTEVVFKEYDSS